MLSFGEWIQRTFAICIVTTQDKPELLSKLDFLRGLGVEPDYCRTPAIPVFVKGTKKLATAEWELALTDTFAARALREPVGVAVSIAHLRAIRQSLADNPHKWVCIFEDDVEPTGFFGTTILAALLAVSGSKKQRDIYEAFHVADQPPAIIYLSSSQRALTQMHRAQNAKIVWRQEWRAPGAPLLIDLGGPRSRLKWVGQGARGYILSPDFAQYVLAQRIGNHWDLHLIDLAKTFEGWGALVFPQAVVHRIIPDMPGRGSSRLTLDEDEDENVVTRTRTLSIE